jgi:hypothetical protein
VEPRANLPAEYLIANAAVIFTNAQRERARLRIHLLARFNLGGHLDLFLMAGQAPTQPHPWFETNSQTYRTGIETAVRATTAGQLTDAPYRDVTATA